MFYRNLRPYIALLTFMAPLATIHCGPIKTMVENNPDQIIQTIQTADYPTLLQFVQDAYSESKAENDGPITQYVYTIALDRAPTDKQVRLATDFSLAQSDLDMKQMGARAITKIMLSGSSVPQVERENAINKLKNELGAIGQQRASYGFASQAANALIALGDQSGLDVFLTDAQTVRNYSLKDKWQPASPASLFQTLQSQYLQSAASPTSRDPDWDKLMAAFYGMCASRRSAGQEVKPDQPITDLGRMLK